jgi:hypothetical protein
MSATRLNKGLSVTNRGSAITTNVVNMTRVIPISYSAGTSENETSFALPALAIVKNVYLRVKTAEATGGTKTIDVGTLSTDSGDADGFLDGVSVASTGLVGPSITKTTGSNEVYISASTHGALLADQELGTDVAGNTGFINSRHNITSGGKVITWTPGSNDFAELEADIIVEYQQILAD